MSELSQALKKSASTIILGVALAGSLAGLGYSIHTNRQMEKAYEHNMHALSDTIHYYTGKNGITVANKDIWVGPINDAFEERFKELQEQLNNMKIRNADQVVYVETEVVNEVHDTTYIIDRNLEYLKKEFNFSNNFGQKLENAVYVELRRREKEIFYFHDKGECDFVIREGKDIVAAYQVTVSLKDEKTRKREEDGLKAAMDAFGLREGYIITKDETEERKLSDGRVVHVVPFYRWIINA